MLILSQFSYFISVVKEINPHLEIYVVYLTNLSKIALINRFLFKQLLNMLKSENLPGFILEANYTFYQKSLLNICWIIIQNIYLGILQLTMNFHERIDILLNRRCPFFNVEKLLSSVDDLHVNKKCKIFEINHNDF